MDVPTRRDISRTVELLLSANRVIYTASIGTTTDDLE